MRWKLPLVGYGLLSRVLAEWWVAFDWYAATGDGSALRLFSDRHWCTTSPSVICSAVCCILKLIGARE